MSFYRKHKRIYAPHSNTVITKQEFKDECDINNILNQFKKTGILNHITSLQPHFDDLPSNLDYQHALNIQIQADEIFNSLPSAVREHFGNDPARFLSSFEDPGQHAYLKEKGFIRPDKPAPPAPAAGAPSPDATPPVKQPASQT